MKRKINLLVMLLMLAATTAWGQEYTPKEVENPEQLIEAIEKEWAKHPLKVGKAWAKARARDFAQAFCQQHQDYPPNAAMVDYLKKPGKYTWEVKHYYVEDDPRHGYIKCDMGGQFDYMTEMCFWRRPNGHSLVGILMQIGHEGEGTKDDYALLFYDFNPSTSTLSPDLQTYTTVKNLIAKHKGAPNLQLPQEGKNIQVTCAQWIGDQCEDADFQFDQFELRWTGNGFKADPSEINRY